MSSFSIKRNATPPSEGGEMGILWSSVMRDSTILAEAGEDESTDQEVVNMALELVKKKPTPGWEFSRKRNLRGVKFHVYEPTTTGASGDHIIWSFGCVYNPNLVKRDQAKSFLEKIVFLTDGYWRESVEWRTGSTLVAQESFAPILFQRMQEVSYMGRVAMVNQEVDNLKQHMASNIDMLLEREEYLQTMDERSSALQEMSKQFKKNTQKVKRFQMWQNAKHGMVVGTAVTAGVAVAVVPPLVALL